MQAKYSVMAPLPNILTQLSQHGIKHGFGISRWNSNHYRTHYRLHVYDCGAETFSRTLILDCKEITYIKDKAALYSLKFYSEENVTLISRLCDDIVKGYDVAHSGQYISIYNDINVIARMMLALDGCHKDQDIRLKYTSGDEIISLMHDSIKIKKHQLGSSTYTYAEGYYYHVDGDASIKPSKNLNEYWDIPRDVEDALQNAELCSYYRKICA
jgi:hypothetical protein